MFYLTQIHPEKVTTLKKMRLLQFAYKCLRAITKLFKTRNVQRNFHISSVLIGLPTADFWKSKNRVKFWARRRLIPSLVFTTISMLNTHCTFSCICTSGKKLPKPPWEGFSKKHCREYLIGYSLVKRGPPSIAPLQ